MTQWMFATLGLAIGGQIPYHMVQRAVPVNASPFAVLAVAYFAAGALCVMLAWSSGAFKSGPHLRSAVSWPTWLIALAILAIELGYLSAYRSGWTIGTAFVTASTRIFCVQQARVLFARAVGIVAPGRAAAWIH